MSTTGLFLSLFLVVHLAGNLQLLINDGGETFIKYAEIMEANLLIRAVAIVLYLAILLHAYKGIILWLHNRKARGSAGYRMKSNRQTSWASRNMAMLGSLMFIFIAIHMSQFWYAYKFGSLEEVEHFTIIKQAFKQEWIVALYVLAQITIAYHLLHGFQSAFQTLGVRTGKYTGLIKWVGIAFSIVIPLLFAIIPIMMYNDLYLLPEFKVIPGQ